MGETHIFQLLTGVECEIKYKTGDHQEIFSNKKNISDGSFISKFMASIVVRIGSKRDITEKDIDNLLTADRKKIFCEIHAFESDFDPLFKFTYKYSVGGKQHEREIEINLSEVKETPYHFKTSDGTFEPLLCAEYSEVLEKREQSYILPKSGKEVFFRMLDGNAEKRMKDIDENKLSRITDIALRIPEYKMENGLRARLDLMKARSTDIEALRIEIKKYEGDIDTVVEFDNPHDIGKIVRFDFTTVSDFLFPAVL
jgi:hypothetical protein